MIAEIRLFEVEGYQEDGYSAPTRWVEVNIRTPDGKVKLNIGRIFFTDFGPESTWAKLNPAVTVATLSNEIGATE